MARNIIHIDEEKCIGCGLCVRACHEGALQLVNGKAKLVSEAYCDGLGKCLPACPVNALVVEEREAVAFDKEANEQRKKIKSESTVQNCPGSAAVSLHCSDEPAGGLQTNGSQLRQWPCQIKLVAPNAPFFENADLLIAADCTAFAYADIHNKFMKNKITLIGCPKLDEVNYADKLAEILRLNTIKRITVLRMSVPCCGGMVKAVEDALRKSDKVIPWQITIVKTDGELSEDW